MREGGGKRLISTAVYYICSNSNCANVCSLNNACDARDFTLTRRYLIELMGKMPSLSLGKHMRRRQRRGGAGQGREAGGRTCNFAIYIAGFEFTLASN